MLRTTDRIIAIGASTGGTEAIREVLEEMPPDAPAIVISQHIPAAFSKSFADRMNRSSPMAVCEAQDGQQILPGHAYIAPGDRHLLVERDGARYLCRLSNGPHVNRHRPSVDVMFRSVAQNVGANAVGVLLTGMGDDGARGLREMLDSGRRDDRAGRGEQRRVGNARIGRENRRGSACSAAAPNCSADSRPGVGRRRSMT